MGLDRYRSMRDFGVTDEPGGQGEPRPSGHERAGRPRFVVQEHHATALHWDFRLERGGVLVSWAVPRGLPPDPRVNRLAVATEDHPLDYLDFEGPIPAGQYGAGSITVWDRGTYRAEKFSDREVMVELHGSRVRGRYVLFATGEGPKAWMMHRMDPPEDPARELMPADPRPAEPEPGAPVDGPGWLCTVAWGGTRVALAVDGGRCVARTAAGADVTGQWSELGPFGRAVGALGSVFVAELVRPEPRGPAAVLLEDLMWLDGHSTAPLAFGARRSLLEGLDLDGPSWRTAPAYDVAGPVLEAARSQRLPGILARRDEPGFGPPRFVPA